ncbi:MAG: NAD-dependent epimerase/dehydratase family protein [SAR202 cluster bacterium]|nr:NAD-dependent epimerase/dehydratase family protein [SAR202 cluster bacterium]
MKTLITGGAGFIGSHLAERLLCEGHQVTALDSMSTGSWTNVQHLSSEPNFRLVDGSILDIDVLGPLVAEADTVYHLAAAVGVKLIMEQLVATLESNVQGTENVVRLAHEAGNKKVIIASSSEVYGKNPAVPWNEDDDILLGPTSFGRWGYACSKMLDEFLALAYNKEKGLPVVILRLFNTVGPRQSAQYGMVLPRFVSQAMAGKPLTVYGDGLQSRCFTYVGDVVNAIYDISQVTGAAGQVFNIGSDSEVNINQLAETVKDTLGSSSEIIHVPYNNAYGLEFEDVARRIPGIAKIQSYIDFQPRSDLGSVINEIASTIKSAHSAA